MTTKKKTSNAAVTLSSFTCVLFSFDSFSYRVSFTFLFGSWLISMKKACPKEKSKLNFFFSFLFFFVFLTEKITVTFIYFGIHKTETKLCMFFLLVFCLTVSSYSSLQVHEIINSHLIQQISCCDSFFLLLFFIYLFVLYNEYFSLWFYSDFGQRMNNITCLFAFFFLFFRFVFQSRIFYINLLHSAKRNNRPEKNMTEITVPEINDFTVFFFRYTRIIKEITIHNNSAKFPFQFDDSQKWHSISLNRTTWRLFFPIYFLPLLCFAYSLSFLYLILCEQWNVKQTNQQQKNIKECNNK